MSSPAVERFPIPRSQMPQMSSLFSNHEDPQPKPKPWSSLITDRIPSIFWRQQQEQSPYTIQNVIGALETHLFQRDPNGEKFKLVAYDAEELLMLSALAIKNTEAAPFLSELNENQLRDLSPEDQRDIHQELSKITADDLQTTAKVVAQAGQQFPVPRSQMPQMHSVFSGYPAPKPKSKSWSSLITDRLPALPTLRRKQKEVSPWKIGNLITAIETHCGTTVGGQRKQPLSGYTPEELLMLWILREKEAIKDANGVAIKDINDLTAADPQMLHQSLLDISRDDILTAARIVGFYQKRQGQLFPLSEKQMHPMWLAYPDWNPAAPPKASLKDRAKQYALSFIRTPKPKDKPIPLLNKVIEDLQPKIKNKSPLSTLTVEEILIIYTARFRNISTQEVTVGKITKAHNSLVQRSSIFKKPFPHIAQDELIDSISMVYPAYAHQYRQQADKKTHIGRTMGDVIRTVAKLTPTEMLSCQPEELLLLWTLQRKNTNKQHTDLADITDKDIVESINILQSWKPFFEEMTKTLEPLDPNSFLFSSTRASLIGDHTKTAVLALILWRKKHGRCDELLTLNINTTIESTKAKVYTNRNLIDFDNEELLMYYAALNRNIHINEVTTKDIINASGLISLAGKVLDKPFPMQRIPSLHAIFPGYVPHNVSGIRPARALGTVISSTINRLQERDKEHNPVPLSKYQPEEVLLIWTALRAKKQLVNVTLQDINNSIKFINSTNQNLYTMRAATLGEITEMDVTSAKAQSSLLSNLSDFKKVAPQSKPTPQKTQPPQQPLPQPKPVQAQQPQNEPSQKILEEFKKQQELEKTSFQQMSKQIEELQKQFKEVGQGQKKQLEENIVSLRKEQQAALARIETQNQQLLPQIMQSLTQTRGNLQQENSPQPLNDFQNPALAEPLIELQAQQRMVMLQQQALAEQIKLMHQEMSKNAAPKPQQTDFVQTSPSISTAPSPNSSTPTPQKQIPTVAIQSNSSEQQQTTSTSTSTIHVQPSITTVTPIHIPSEIHSTEVMQTEEKPKPVSHLENLRTMVRQAFTQMFDRLKKQIANLGAALHSVLRFFSIVKT
jgi:hypothetical protein